MLRGCAGSIACRLRSSKGCSGEPILLLGSHMKMWSDCHSPSDCHSLIMSGQRGWKYSLSLYHFAAAIATGVAVE